VNVRSQKCRFEGGCDKVPSYGEKNGTAKFCIAHKVSVVTTHNTYHPILVKHIMHSFYASVHMCQRDSDVCVLCASARVLRAIAL
jgi:coproporphyrinogen III oxidase